jgi:hypothetical protein
MSSNCDLVFIPDTGGRGEGTRAKSFPVGFAMEQRKGGKCFQQTLVHRLDVLRWPASAQADALRAGLGVRF